MAETAPGLSTTLSPVLGRGSASGSLPAPVADIDRALAVAGDDVGQIRALEELAEAAKRYATTHEQRVEASAAKFRIARHGGGVLIRMLERGERAQAGDNQHTRGSSGVELPTAEGLVGSRQRSMRWQAIARLDDDEAARREQAIRDSDPDAELGAAPHIGENSGQSEWFTPAEYVEAARRVMGGIDLDPASTEIANGVVKATTFYTAAQDGLGLPWAGRVWLNPPYSQPLVTQFCERLASECESGTVTQACALVNNATETGWFQRMARASAAICFPDGRVRFWHPERASAPLQGQATIYFGERIDAFRADFLAFGFVVTL